MQKYPISGLTSVIRTYDGFVLLGNIIGKPKSIPSGKTKLITVNTTQHFITRCFLHSTIYFMESSLLYFFNNRGIKVGLRHVKELVSRKDKYIGLPVKMQKYKLQVFQFNRNPAAY